MVLRWIRERFTGVGTPMSSNPVKPAVSDDELLSNIQALLALIVPEAFLTRGIQKKEEVPFDAWFTDEEDKINIPYYREHAIALREHLRKYEIAHNQLMSIRPRRTHQRLHELVGATSYGYMMTLNARATVWHLLTVPWDDSTMEQSRRCKDDAVQWDKSTHQCAVLLISAIRNSSLEVEVPEGLEYIADEYTAKLFGSIFFGGGELFRRDS